MAFARKVLWGPGGAAVAITMVAAGCGDDDCTRTLTCPTGSGGEGGTGAGTSEGGSTTSGMGGDMGDPNGTACTDGGTCQSGICADDVCCDAACDGTCESCAVAGAEGTCTPYATGEDPEDECELATCDGAGACQVGEALWGFAFGDGTIQRVADVQVDNMGNIYVAGRFEGTIMLGDQTLTSAGNTDIFVAKFAASGNVVWARRYGDEQFQSVVDIYVGSRVYVAGEYQGNPTFTNVSLVQSDKTGWFIAALDTADGQSDWATGQPDNSTNVFIGLGIEAIVETPSTVYAITSSGTALSPNYTLRKFSSANGNESASQDAGTDVSPAALARTASGSLLMMGSFEGTTNVLGTGPTLTAVGRDAFVAQVSSSLTTQSATSFGGSGNEYALDIVELPGGEYVVAGYGTDTFTVGADTLTNQGGNDAFLVRLSPQLGNVGGTSFGGSGADIFRAIAVGTDHVVAVGTSDGPLDIGGPLPAGMNNGLDAILVKVDAATFAPVWARRGGTKLNQSATAVGIDAIDRIAVGGTFTEDLDLGLPFTSAGQDDGFLLQLSP